MPGASDMVGWGQSYAQEVLDAEPGLVPHAVVDPGWDDRTLLTEEQPPVVRRAGGGQVLAEHGDEVRRDGHPPDVFGRPVLQPAVVMGLPRVGPLLAGGRTGPVEQRRAPALPGKVQVRLDEADRFRRPEKPPKYMTANGPTRRRPRARRYPPT